MKFQTVEATERSNIEIARSKSAQESADERKALGQQLKQLPTDGSKILLFDPEEKDGKKETERAMRLKISRSANGVDLKDIQFGKHKSGALAVWRDASAVKKTRKPRNQDGEASTPSAAPASTPKVAVPA